MLAVEAIAPPPADLRALPDDELAALYGAGDDDDQAAILAECARRDRAERARKARQAADAAWFDAAHAQYLAADAECRGHLFSPYGREHGPSDALSLWRGSEAWARRHASEDLCNFWDANGGRLSLARYRCEMAMARRADRDERDLERGVTGPSKPRRRTPKPKWIGCPGGAVMERQVRIGDLTVTAWAAMGYESDAVTIHPTREHAERHLVPPPPPEAAPERPDLSAMTDPDATTAERMVCVAEFGDYLDQQAKCRAERMAAIRERVALLVNRKGTNR